MQFESALLEHSEVSSRSLDHVCNEAVAMVAKDLFLSYGSTVALRGVLLMVGSGNAPFIIGPSGCDKSTLLRTFDLLERPSRGEIRIAGHGLTFGSDGNAP
jgi:ABC-type histidine transport system ATPase subunit